MAVTVFDRAWTDLVCSVCDPIFEAAYVGFVRQVPDPDPARALESAPLWEADPTRFADRYPDSGIITSYGEEQWRTVHCIDYWVTIDHEASSARVSVEGWNFPDVSLELSGNALDAYRLADLFARILGVRSPLA